MVAKKTGAAVVTRFTVDDKVVYPGHGVATITRIVEKTVGSEIVKFFELKFLSKDMTILVPTLNFIAAGIRPVSTSISITSLFKKLSEPVREIPSYELTASNWNKRNKEYQLKIRSGDLFELSEIYRELNHISLQKELSFGEKTLLHQTEALLAEEISIVERLAQEQALMKLRESCGKIGVASF